MKQTDGNVVPWLLSVTLFAIKIIASCGLLVTLFYFEILRWSDLQRLFGEPTIILFAGTLIFKSFFLNAVRWRMLLKTQGYDLSMGKLFPIYYISMVCAPILPGGLGGDLVRVGYVAKLLPEKKTGAIVSVLLDRVIGLSSIILLSFVAIAFFFFNTTNFGNFIAGVGFALGALGAAVLIFFFFALYSSSLGILANWLEENFQYRIVRYFVGVLDAFKNCRNHRSVVFAAVGLSLLIQFMLVFAIWLTAWRLGFEKVSLVQTGVAMPLAQIANILPFTPGGLGVGEAAFDLLLTGLSEAQLIGAGYGSIFLTYRGVSILVSLPAVGFYILSPKLYQKD